MAYKCVVVWNKWKDEISRQLKSYFYVFNRGCRGCGGGGRGGGEEGRSCDRVGRVTGNKAFLLLLLLFGPIQSRWVYSLFLRHSVMRICRYSENILVYVRRLAQVPTFVFAFLAIGNVSLTKYSNSPFSFYLWINSFASSLSNRCLSRVYNCNFVFVFFFSFFQIGR